MLKLVLRRSPSLQCVCVWERNRKSEPHGKCARVTKPVPPLPSSPRPPPATICLCHVKTQYVQINSGWALITHKHSLKFNQTYSSFGCSVTTDQLFFPYHIVNPCVPRPNLSSVRRQSVFFLTEHRKPFQGLTVTSSVKGESERSGQSLQGHNQRHTTEQTDINT